MNASELAALMIEAARTAVSTRWPRLATLAGLELRRLAQCLVDVAGLLASGQIEEPHARQLVHMYQLSARGVLLTIKGIGLLTAEQVIQAGTHVAAEAVNGVAKLELV